MQMCVKVQKRLTCKLKMLYKDVYRCTTANLPRSKGAWIQSISINTALFEVELLVTPIERFLIKHNLYVPK